jgi:hypothetical protein
LDGEEEVIDFALFAGQSVSDFGGEHPGRFDRVTARVGILGFDQSREFLKVSGKCLGDWVGTHGGDRRKGRGEAM